MCYSLSKHRLDYSYAFLRDTPPVYDKALSANLLYSGAISQVEGVSAAGSFLISSPLLYHDAFHEASRYAAVTLSPSVLGVLEDAFEATKYLSEARGYHSTPAGEFLSSSHWSRIQALPVLSPEQVQELQRHAQQEGSGASAQTAAAAGYVSEACRLAARMHHRAVFRRVPHAHPQNAEDLKRLYFAVYWANLHAWRGIPYIYVWV